METPDPRPTAPPPTLPGLALALGLLLIPGAAAPLTAAPPQEGAPPAGDRLDEYAVAGLRSVTAAEISPDGTRAAYVLGVPRRPFVDDDGASWAELHVADLGDAGGGGAATRSYVGGEVRVGSVAWTPDGAAIAFVAKRQGDEDPVLYVIPADGGEARRLIEHAPGVSGYSFAPDGRRLAFLARRDQTEEAKALEKKGFDAVVVEERQRPVELWLAELPDGPLGEAGEPRRLELPGSASELHWSPRGDRLAVALAPTPSIDDEYMQRRVRIVDPADGSVVASVDNPGKLGEIAWSPDGSRLAMISAADYNDPREGRLMVVDAAGGAPRDLVPGLPGHVTDFAWLGPETLLYLADRGLDSSLERVAVGGGEPVVLSPDDPLVWEAISVSADGRRAALRADSPEHPSELFDLRLGDGGAVEGVDRVTRSNPWLDGVRLGRQEAVSFAARDGLELQGILIHPLDERPGTRYPLILTVHGGPESHYRNGWLTGYALPGQMAAGRGYAVFYPNYRGSTGRGVEFSKLSQADPAGAEFDDLVDAVDHLVATGLADRDRVGISGGSYGGYATAWASTRFTDRFAAGVMFVGVSELISKNGTSDIPNELYAVHERRWPWEDWDLMLERSPVHYVEQARTPLLILGGDADPRVHPSQSLTLFRFLKILGKTPVRLVQYPGEEHGNRRAAARLDYSLRMMRWFEHYLKGPGGDPPPPDLEYRRPDEGEED